MYNYQATSPSAEVWVQRLETASTQHYAKVGSLLKIFPVSLVVHPHFFSFMVVSELQVKDKAKRTYIILNICVQ